MLVAYTGREAGGRGGPVDVETGAGNLGFERL